MKNPKSIFIYPKYSCLITQRINVTFTIRDCSRSAAACHNLALPLPPAAPTSPRPPPCDMNEPPAASRRAALVTGGAQRIGRAIALALAQHGYAVALQTRGSRGEGGRLCAELTAAARAA